MLLEVRLQRYGRKRLFDRYIIEFMVLAILVLKHLRLFCVDWKYGCQNTGDNIYLPVFKLCLRHSPFYF